ncbi:uncharacterized protein LOC136091931 [Hydra vulgaris]|uniref:Uncharacterized protein LOC136091931 n=1 Tax=Hydra vulgaris TaxID=6087 RepID=A0ABM4DMF4_HYDVU
MSLPEGGDRRRYNIPSHDEVVVVFVGKDGAPPTSRKVVIYPRGHPLKIVSNAYVKIEGQRLAFIKNTQNKLRSEHYNALHEHVNNIANKRHVRPGQVVIFPSCYVGPRALKENFKDAMAIIKKYGKPDLLITFLCNPKWREITENLSSGQTANDTPDLIIEFQKHGLPLAHILLHLANDDKLETAQDINNLLCAENQDPIVNRELYDIIITCMIYGPCGILNPNSPCIKDKVCSKNYPNEFNAYKVAIHNGYLQYRRRDDGLVINIKGNNVDNRWVVPYNPWLSKKYQAHINVKSCMSVKAVKYLYQYIYKGDANVLINEQVNHNEVNTFLGCRYVSAPEALW